MNRPSHYSREMDVFTSEERRQKRTKLTVWSGMRYRTLACGHLLCWIAVLQERIMSLFLPTIFTQWCKLCFLTTSLPRLSLLWSSGSSGFHEHNDELEYLIWPTYSLYLIIIEHLCSILGKKLSSLSLHPRTLFEIGTLSGNISHIGYQQHHAKERPTSYLSIVGSLHC